MEVCNTSIGFIIRVTDDEKHAIYVQDFEAFEETVIYLCRQHIGTQFDFSVVFEEVSDVDFDES